MYQAVREAGDAELAKTASGKKLLNDTRALGRELREIHLKIASGKTSYGEGHRTSLQRRLRFRDKHQSALLKAYSRHARLQPSVDAIAAILHPQEAAAAPVWVAEIAFLQAVLLTPSAAPSDVGAVKQGLGDPTPPQPVNVCISAPYARKSTSEWNQLVGFAIAGATPSSGMLFTSAQGLGFDGAAGAGSAEAFVGDDLSVPAGHTGYELSVDVDWTFNGSSFAVGGVAVCGSGITVRVDQMDGSQTFDTNHPLFSLVSPVIWGNGANGSGSTTVVVPITLANANARKIRVMVGVGSHGEAWATFSSMGSASASATVKKICLDSTM